MTSHYLPIVQGITNAISEIDEKSLVTEGCRTALLALRYHGNHHRCFWSDSIDEVLYKIIAESCSSEHQTHQMLCHGELFQQRFQRHCEYRSLRMGYTWISSSALQ